MKKHLNKALFIVSILCLTASAGLVTKTRKPPPVDPWIMDYVVLAREAAFCASAELADTRYGDVYHQQVDQLRKAEDTIRLVLLDLLEANAANAP